MKLLKIFAAALLTCAALVFTSCEEGVTNTGDQTGDVYGVWQLDSKTVDGSKDTDFGSEHFYLWLTPIRVAIAKQGSLTALDFKNLDIDGTVWSYNSVKQQLSFDEHLILSNGPMEVMNLYGTYDVKELSKSSLVISKVVGGSTTTYSFHKLYQQEEVQTN
jgi:hypothetical protein